MSITIAAFEGNPELPLGATYGAALVTDGRRSWNGVTLLPVTQPQIDEYIMNGTLTPMTIGMTINEHATEPAHIVFAMRTDLSAIEHAAFEIFGYFARASAECDGMRYYLFEETAPFHTACSAVLDKLFSDERMVEAHRFSLLVNFISPNDQRVKDRWPWAEKQS